MDAREPSKRQTTPRSRREPLALRAADLPIIGGQQLRRRAQPYLRALYTIKA